MKNYYKILELTPEAESAEIKKSYFQLVRKYPPDKEPDKFQEIREAYEYLQKEDNREEYRRIYRIPSPFREVYQCAQGYEKNRDYALAIAACREGLRVEPVQEDLNRYLAQLYMKNGETGKAVKQLEEIVRKAPNNLNLAGMLAIAYDKRGWNKKAELQYDKVYKLGERSQEFLLSFANNLLKQNYYIDARKLLLEIINNVGSSKRSESSFLSEVFSLIFVSDVEYGEENLLVDFELFEDFLQGYKDNGKGRREIMLDVLYEVMAIFDARIHEVGILEALTKLISKDKERSFTEDQMNLLLDTNFLIEKSRLVKDDRLGDEFECAVDVYHDKARTLGEAKIFFQEEIEQAELDVKLQIIEAWPGIHSQINIVKAEYPLLAQEMKDFLEELENCDNTSFLWNKYEKIYCKKAGYPANAHLSRKRASVGEEIDEQDEFSFYQEPYRREEPKIGRNDPCPCGSGKKYKKCCGR